MMTLTQGIFIGIVATVLIDLWAALLKAFSFPAANWAMVGRWVGHMPRGEFIQPHIADAEPVKGERLIGWCFHYGVGVVYGIAYLWFVQDLLQRTPDIVSAIAFSLVLIVTPWFIMQPGLGHGIAASKAPKPWLVRGLNIIVHALFGVGLYLGWLILDSLMK